jgi:hypothetical protein
MLRDYRLSKRIEVAKRACVYSRSVQNGSVNTGNVNLAVYWLITPCDVYDIYHLSIFHMSESTATINRWKLHSLDNVIASAEKEANDDVFVAAFHSKRYNTLDSDKHDE